MIINKEYFQDKDIEIKEKKLKLPVLEALIQGRKNIIKGSSSDSEKEIIDNHEYVDLGLPSGTKWATMNIGASSITDYGNYYMYGLGASQYDNTQTSYSGTESPLADSADTAVQVWGGQWHMPTTTQIEELKSNTTYEWISDYEGSGVSGGKFTAQNGNFLFIPAAGFYADNNSSNVGVYGYIWSSSPKQNNKAYYLAVNSGGSLLNNEYREGGFSVRPVAG